MTKHAGDPTPRSAGDVLADRAYRMMVAEQVPPQVAGQSTMNVIVVQHCGTETYWTTTYLAPQARLAMQWQQVAPVVETRTIYRPVS